MADFLHPDTLIILATFVSVGNRACWTRQPDKEGPRETETHVLLDRRTYGSLASRSQPTRGHVSCNIEECKRDRRKVVEQTFAKARNVAPQRDLAELTGRQFRCLQPYNALFLGNNGTLIHRGSYVNFPRCNVMLDGATIFRLLSSQLWTSLPRYNARHFTRVSIIDCELFSRNFGEAQRDR